jgi:Queuine tRNA-ribosyltransferase
MATIPSVQADCVFPTRTARFGVALTSKGPLNLRWSFNVLELFKRFMLSSGLRKHSHDLTPIEDGCPCPTCASGTSKAMLHHIVTLETSGAHGLLSVLRDSPNLPEPSCKSAQHRISVTNHGRRSRLYYQWNISRVSQNILFRLFRRLWISTMVYRCPKECRRRFIRRSIESKSYRR